LPVKYLLTYGLAVMILAPGGRAVTPNPKNKNIKAILSVAKKRITNIISLNCDTLAIPDDTIPDVIIPAGTIQVSTNHPGQFNNGIKTLGCGSYNQQTFVGPKSAKLQWKGLFESKTRFYISNTKLRLKRDHSELDEDKNQKTGWLVNCDNKDTNIILINGAKDVVNGLVKKALLSTTLYYAGQKLEFKYYGVKYTLYTTGFKKNGRIFNYKLFLLAKVKGGYFNQLLASLPPDVSFGGGGDMSTKVEIEFAGDMDGDKIPDFIISESGYAFGFSYLYLSRAAGKKAILKEVSFYGNTD
jgi:hypothetical protein